MLLLKTMKLARQGLKFTLKEEGMEVVGETDNGEAAVELVKKLKTRRDFNGYRNANIRWHCGYKKNKIIRPVNKSGYADFS